MTFPPFFLLSASTSVIIRFLKNYGFIIAIFFTIITIIGSLTPSKNLPSGAFKYIPYLDKWIHVGMYGVLGFFWLNVMRINNFRWLWVLFGLFLLGFILEMLQYYFFVGRFFEIHDIIANITGSIAGCFLYERLYRKQVMEQHLK